MAFTVALMAVFAIAVPFIGTAQATHPPNCSLEVLEEVDTNPAGSTHTLTAQLFAGSGSTPCTVNTSTTLNVNVDFEVESGPPIRANCTFQTNNVCSGGSATNDGISPNTPDMTCDIGSAGGVGTAASSCQVTFTADAGGTNLVRAFIDHDRNNAGASSPTYDGTEGRYAGPTDCGTNVGGTGRTSTGTGPGTGTRCDFDAAQPSPFLPAEPGGIGEPDTTDVVQKSWTQGLTGNTCLDVDPNSDTNASGTEHVITATVTTATTRTASSTSDTSGDSCNTNASPGLPREGVQVDFSLNDIDTGIAGSDDPNAFFSKINEFGTNPSGGGPNNVTCITAPNGTCTVTIRTVSATAIGDNYVIGRVPGSTGGAGGGCSNAVFSGGTGGTGTGAGDSCTAEVVRKIWASPGTITGVNASPEEDTNAVNTQHTITATTINVLGDPVSGQTITFDVTSGINATGDIDNNPSTPGGFIGQCSAGPSGSCSVSYTSTLPGDDTITACIDANATFDCDATENDSGNTTVGDANDDQVIKHWVTAGSEASRISVDMEGCNGSTTNPADTATYQETATPNEVTNDRNDAHAVCATVFNSANITVRTPVTFTITSGPGRFVLPSNTNNTTFTEGSDEDLGASVTVDPGTCASGAGGPGAPSNAATTGTGRGSGTYNCAFLLSEISGSTVVRACVEGSTTICDTGTKPWQTVTQNARFVAVTPETDTNPPGTNHEFTATITDRFGNGVPGVAITWSRTGEGVIVSQENTTNAEGEAVIVVRSETAGTTTVTATISGTSSDCDEAANAPTGREAATAGNCSDSGTKTWDAAGDTECSDTTDNDGDGNVDLDDQGCSSSADDSENTDMPRACRGRSGAIVGTPGADVLPGTSGPDVICGAGGADVIRSLGGNDLVFGNGGDDAIRGGKGRDNLSGNGGRDSVLGNDGNDVIKGQAGNDTLKGGDGNDTLNGGRGRDRCFGNRGRDSVRNCE